MRERRIGGIPGCAALEAAPGRAAAPGATDVKIVENLELQTYATGGAELVVSHHTHTLDQGNGKVYLAYMDTAADRSKLESRVAVRPPDGEVDQVARGDVGDRRCATAERIRSLVPEKVSFFEMLFEDVEQNCLSHRNH